MPEADVQTPAAESSPAPQTPAQVTPVSVPTDPEAYAKWRQTGELPEPKPSKEDSAPSKSVKTAPDSDTGKRQDKSADKPADRNADTRKEELNREIRDLIAKRDELKQEVSGKGKQDVKAEPSPAPPEDSNKRPVKPKQDDFDTWEKYEAAQDKYLEDLADWKAEQKFQEHEQKRRQEATTQEMQNRLDEAKTRYGAEAEPKIVSTAKAVFDDQGIAPAIKAAVGRSDVIVDALYVMGSDEKELSEFVKLSKSDPLEALRKWFTVEALVKQELGKATNGNGASPPRGLDGKFQSEKSEKPPVKAREAPPPPTEVNPNGSPTGDELGRAADSGNFRAFKEIADRKDMARFRGQ